MKYCKGLFFVLVVAFVSIIIVTISIQVVLSRQVKLRSHSLKTQPNKSYLLSQEKFGSQQKFIAGRYVIAESYWEQMTRATINIYDLIKFATEWQGSVPIPFLVDTFPRGFPSINRGSRRIETSFSLLFDMYKVQKNLISKNLTPFVDFDQFLLNFNSSCNNMYNSTFVVTIEFVSCKENIEGSGSNDLYHVSKVPCTSEYKKIMKHLYKVSHGTFLNFEEHWSNYSSSLTCCNVCGIIPTLSSDISIGCGFHGLSEFTVIFKQWRGLSLPLHGSFRLFGPTNYMERYRAPSPALPHSWFIKSKANEFLNHYLIGNNSFVAVHTRTEKIHITEKKMKINGTKCVLDAIMTARNVSQVKGIRHIMFFTDKFALDYYGDVFRAQNVTITNYNPKIFHLQPESDGIVAQIEQNIASRAAVLVLSGGGSFQYVIKRRFMSFNKSNESKKLIYEFPCSH